jgi:hypothetical protein
LFDGGLNTKFERSIIDDNESPDCLNVVFEDGAVGTRGGSAQLNTTAVGSFAVDGLYTRRGSDAAETMIVAAGALFYTLDGASTFVTIPSAQSVFTAGTRIDAAQYEDHIFFGNGDATPYKYNGTDFTRHGVPAATGTVTAISGTTAVGTLTGDYRWKITFVNSQAVEGDVGTAPATIALTSGQGYLTGIPTAPQSHGVNSRRIYRTVTSGSTFLLAGTIADNTTTTYNDNADDDELTTTAPTDNGEPPNYDIVEYHQNRIWCNDADNENYIWYSDLNEPYTFQTTSFFRVGDAAADLVTGMYVHQNNVYVFCENSIWVIYMPDTTPGNWNLIRVTSSFGSKSPFAPFRFQDKMMFAAMQNDQFAGFAAIQGSTIDPAATALDTMAIGSELRSEPVEPTALLAQRAYLSNITSMVHKNKGYIAFTYGSGNLTNNRLLIYDFSLGRLSKNQRESWSLYDGINVSQMTQYSGKLYGGSSLADGLVYELETTDYTDGSGSTAINSYFWTKEFAGVAGHENVIKDLAGHENVIKDFRKVRVLVDKPGDYKMNVAVRVDSESGSAGLSYEIDLNPGGSIWQSFLWGQVNWGGGRAQDEFEVPLGGISGRRIQFKFTNQDTASQRFKVHGLNFTYNVRGTT